MPAHRVLPAIVFAAGTTAGTLAAVGATIALAQWGIDLFGVWRFLSDTTQAQFHSALAWWAVAGSGFVTGFCIAFAMSRFAWLYLRSLRVVALAVVVFGFAALMRLAPSGEGVPPAAYLVANTAAIMLAAAMSAAGAFFAMRR
jgi:hypothetical protein